MTLLTVAGYGSLATAAMTIGGAIAGTWPPGARARSYLQHVAAGFVFAAAAVEVLPDVLHNGRALAAGLGFAAGVALALSIRLVSERQGKSGGQASFVGVLLADIFIDGLLIGVTSTAGRAQTGFLVALAVAVELLSLGLSMAATLSGASRARVIGTTAAMSVTPLAGAVAGYFVGRTIGPGWTEGILAFAVAVFLFMAAEELLKEAHESPETPLATALLFAAFLALLLLDMAGRS